MCFEFILVSNNQMNYLTYISVYAESFPSFKIQHFIFIFYWLFENCRENQIESNKLQKKKSHLTHIFGSQISETPNL